MLHCASCSKTVPYIGGLRADRVGWESLPRRGSCTGSKQNIYRKAVSSSKQLRLSSNNSSTLQDTTPVQPKSYPEGASNGRQAISAQINVQSKKHLSTQPVALARRTSSRYGKRRVDSKLTFDSTFFQGVNSQIEPANQQV